MFSGDASWHPSRQKRDLRVENELIETVHGEYYLRMRAREETSTPFMTRERTKRAPWKRRLDLFTECGAFDVAVGRLSIS